MEEIPISIFLKKDNVPKSGNQFLTSWFFLTQFPGHVKKYVPDAMIKTIFKIIVPAASSGLIAGIILGVGRAIGETMAVIMVAGNVANMPNLLSPVRLLTTGIVLEMSYSSGLHRQALFAIGLVLFVFIMIVNTSFMYISKRR